MMAFLPTHWRVLLGLCTLIHLFLVVFMVMVALGTMGVRGDAFETFILLIVLPCGSLGLISLLVRPYYRFRTLLTITLVIIANIFANFIMIIAYHFGIWVGAIIFPLMLMQAPVVGLYYAGRLFTFTYIANRRQ